MGVKTISSKTSYVESSASKSDVIDSLTHPVKCEDLTASTTSILREQTVVKVESNIKIEKSDQQPATLEDPVVSDYCGSNVTQEEQGHMAEGDLDGKVEVGYDIIGFLIVCSIYGAINGFYIFQNSTSTACS